MWRNWVLDELKKKKKKGNCRTQKGDIETRQHSIRSDERTVVRSLIVLLRLVRQSKAMLFDRPVVRLDAGEPFVHLPRYCEGRRTL